MKNSGKLVIALILALSLTACAAGTSESLSAAGRSEFAEFLLGLWHGFIAPITLIGEIIDKVSPGALPWKVRFYETRETSVIYDIGFYLMTIGGPSALFGGFSRRRA